MTIGRTNVFLLFISLLVLTGNIYSQQLYKGGSGDGFASLFITDTCELTGIYIGNGGDGYGYVTYIDTCSITLYSSGSTGSGFSSGIQLQTCIYKSVFNGGYNDGYINAISILCPIDTLAISAIILSHINCVTGDSGTAVVNVIEELPEWGSSPDYTFLWKNLAGDTIRITSPGTVQSDTLMGLVEGGYYVYVTDGSSNIDSAYFYVNGCLYRGGAGSGFYSDSIYSGCLLTNIFKGNTSDGADFKILTGTCDVSLYSGGGSGNGFSVNEEIQTCQLSSIYKGETEDGTDYMGIIESCELTLFSSGGSGMGSGNGENINNCDLMEIYRGNSGDGSSRGDTISECDILTFSVGGSGNGFSVNNQETICELLEISQGSSGDGFNYEKYIDTCGLYLFSSGGNGSGFNSYIGLVTCDLSSIFKGDSMDGFSVEVEIPCPLDTLALYAEVLEHMNCITGDSGSAYVHVNEELPFWGSIPDYSYLWRNGLGDTIKYTAVTTNEHDTVTGLTEGEYYIIVTDGSSHRDSVYLYVNGCLYRGGDGYGFSIDTTLAVCTLTNIFLGNQNDGYDYITYIDTCDQFLFSNGGNGSGFGCNYEEQVCNHLNNYKGGSGEGFSRVDDLLNCESKLFSKGGSGNGFDIEEELQSCSISSIFKGDEGDGESYQYSGCTPYIYEYPSSNNTCLMADTLISTGTGDWEMIMRNGQVVIAVNDRGNVLDTIVTEFYIHDAGLVRNDPLDMVPDWYLDRNWHVKISGNLIQPLSNNIGIRLYFLTNELSRLINADDDVTSMFDIGAVKYDGQNQDCQIVNNDPNNDNLTWGYYDPADVTVEVYENGYYMEFDIMDFSEFYVAHSDLPEPYSIQATLQVTSDYNGSDISCYGVSDGEATVTPTVGVPPFTYLWNDPLSQTDSIASGLSAGTYTVTVTDFNGVNWQDSITLVAPDPIVIPGLGTDVSCYGSNDGAIDITVSGGTGFGYNYSWSSVDGTGWIATDEDQSGLTAGTYWVRATDVNACIDSIDFVVDTPDSISITGVIDSITCHNGNDGEIDITVTGGNGGPYSYVWSSVDGSGYVVGDEDQTGLAYGTYVINVTDIVSCSNSTAFVVSNPQQIVLTSTITTVTCPSSSDGEIDLSVSGGTPPYRYLWSTIDGSGLDTLVQDQTGLTTGTYQVQVTDTNDCNETIAFLVGIAPDTIDPSVTSCPADQIVVADSGSCSANVTVPAIIATDNCGITSITNSYNGTSDASGSYPVGTTVVFWTVEDADGNTDTCSTIVTVSHNPQSEPIIEGDTTVCEECTMSYSTHNTGNSFTWVVTGGSITSGQGSNSITVSWDAVSAPDLYLDALIEITEDMGTCNINSSQIVRIYRRPDTGPAYHIPQNWDP